jgi:hypothetical protein
MTLVVKHTIVTGAASDPNAIVDEPAWDAAHTLTGTSDASQLNANVVQSIVNDTNVTGSVSSQTLTLGWTGQLSLSRGGTSADLSATGGAGQYLKQVSAGAAVTIGTIPASDIASGTALTKTDDTNVTLTLGGTPTTALLKATSLTLGWTGTLSIARGGTGQGTQQAAFDALGPTATRAGDIIYWNGTHYVTLAGNNSGTNVLTENASGVPSWSAPGTGTVTSITAGTGLSGGTITTTGTIARDFSEVTFKATAANPTGTTSAAGVMMGLGTTFKITPTKSGRVLFIIGLNVSAATVAGVTVSVQGLYGTGTAPSNGVAQTGTVFDGARANTIPTIGGLCDTVVTGFATGLTLSTQVWFDIWMSSDGTHTATALNIYGSAIEF